jgi:hypothetical protein
MDGNREACLRGHGSAWAAFEWAVRVESAGRAGWLAGCDCFRLVLVRYTSQVRVGLEVGGMTAWPSLGVFERLGDVLDGAEQLGSE